jgi:hypothetical protein
MDSDSDPEPEPGEVQATAEGTVTSDSTGNPIAGADVVVFRTDEGNQVGDGVTSSEGEYEINFTVDEEGAPDELRIEASEEGYLESEATVEFDSQINRDIFLSPKEVDISVQGVVEEDRGGDAIGNATVSILNPEDEELFAETTTGGGGNYNLTFTIMAPNQPSELDLEAVADGFELQNVVVPFDSSLSQNFSLKREPVEINTVDELQKIGRAEGFPSDARYLLTSDIDASQTSAWNGGEGFEPLGNSPFDDFEGVLDGQGFEITGLTIDRSRDGAMALVGTSGNALIQNIRLSEVEIRGESAVGAVVGQVLEGKTEIKNIHVSGNIESVASGGFQSGWHAGGLVGKGGSVQIRNSSFEGNVSGTIFVGGLLGSKGANVEKSHTTNCTVTGENHTGGLVGQTTFSSISSSFSSCNINGDRRAGGLAGTLDETDVTDSYATGDVSGGEDVGGFAGGSRENSMVTESYAAGDVSGTENVGGLIGVNGSSLSDSFWDMESTGQSNAVGEGISGGTGLTTNEMQGDSAEQNMESLDFMDAWQVVTGDYPALSWEDI